MAPPADATAKPVDTTRIEPPALPPADVKPADAAPTPKVGPSGRPVVEHREGTTEVTVTPPNDKFVLRPMLGFGFSPMTGVGGPNGGLFNLDSNPATANSSWTFADIALTADFRVARLFNNNASIFLGPTIGYSHQSSGRSTGGSSMDIGKFGASVAIDWKNSMAAWRVLGPSRFAIMGGLLFGAGQTTAGNHFSVSDTRGTGYNLRAEVDVFGVKINDAGDSIQLGWFGETGSIPQARGDAAYPFMATGPYLSVPLAWPGSIRNEKRVDTDVELCRADKPTLEKLIGELRSKQAQAVGEYEEFKRLAALLAKKGYTPEKILSALRTGYIKKLEAADGENPADKAKLDAAVSAALEAKKAEFEKTIAADPSLKDQAAKDKKLAELQAAERAKVEASFVAAQYPEMDKEVAKVLEAKKPEIEKAVAADKKLKKPEEKAAKVAELLAAEKKKAEALYIAGKAMEKSSAKSAEYLAKATAIYPDGYNHYELTPPELTNLPEDFVVPSDCAQSEALYDRLLEDKSKLDIFRTRIEERTHFLYFALGKPDSKVRKAVDALGGLSFAQFPPLNFTGGRPDYNKTSGPDMKKIKAFYEANKGKVFQPTDPKLNEAFRGIFAGNELPALYDIVQQLNGEKEMRGVKVKKLKPDELKEMVRKIPIIVEAHVSYTDGSTEGNQILSDNRADAVKYAMLLFGFDESRIRVVGKGESEPIVPETVDWTKKGKHNKNLTWAREKNRRVMFWVDAEKMEEAEGTKLAPVGSASAPKPGEPPPPPAAPEKK